MPELKILNLWFWLFICKSFPESNGSIIMMDNFRKSEFSIKTLSQIVEANFPNRWRETEACLATMATLLLQDICNPTVLNLVGSPSSTKTTILSFFRKCDQVYFSDKFTPKSFVSCYANAKAERLSKIDLLPKIQYKTMIVPELAPIFRARAEDLIENISILTRVFDGEGLWIDSGTTGGRGYVGDYMFCFLGATTPLEHNVWKVMGQLGSRMFFLAMRETTKTAKALAQSNSHQYPYKIRKEECQKAVEGFVNKLFRDNPIRSIVWDSKQNDQNTVELIANFSILLARLRGTLQIWSEGQGEEASYFHRRPIIEQPDRANAVLYNFARGRAILYGRRYVTLEDVAMVAEIAFSSMPDDRRHLFQCLIQNGGMVGTSTVAESIDLSSKVAKGLMEQFIALGICEDATAEWNVIYDDKRGSDERAIKLRSNFSNWLFSSAFAGILKSDKPPEIDGDINENEHNLL